MYAAYEGGRDSRTIAQVGADAGTEFDKSSAGPNRVFEVFMR